MNKRKDIRLYNIFLPLWLLVFWPSPLWLILIPLNYIIDRIVLWWGLKGMEQRKDFCRKNTWKICLAGFFGDFIGMMVLFCITFLPYMIIEDFGGSDSWEDLIEEVGFSPFNSIASFLIVAFTIAVSGLIIYLLDKKILTKAGINADLAKSTALKLAVITAPYLYLFPSSLMYSSV